jgi:hypothetical protein
MPVVPTKYAGSVAYAKVFSELLCALGHHGTVSYGRVAEIMGLPPRGNHMQLEVGHLLGEISEAEVRLGRPMLSAVAVTVNGRPGPGFLALARTLGRCRRGTAAQTFWQKERKALVAVWL